MAGEIGRSSLLVSVTAVSVELNKLGRLLLAI